MLTNGLTTSPPVSCTDCAGTKTTTVQKLGGQSRRAIDLLQNPDRRRADVLAGAWVDRLVFLWAMSRCSAVVSLDSMLTLDKNTRIEGNV